MPRFTPEGLTAGAVGRRGRDRYIAGAIVPTARNAMAKARDFDFDSHSDFEMTAGTVERQGHGRYGTELELQ